MNQLNEQNLYLYLFFMDTYPIHSEETLLLRLPRHPRSHAYPVLVPPRSSPLFVQNAQLALLEQSSLETNLQR